MNKYLTIKPGETERQFISRVCMSRESFDMTWDDVRDNCNRELNIHRSESWYRKNYKNGYFTSTKGDEDDKILAVENEDILDDLQNAADVAQVEDMSDEMLAQLTEATNELKKERMKLQDVKTSNNAILRRMAREETIREIAIDLADKIISKRGSYVPDRVDIRPHTTRKSMILQISDWHYGIDIQSHWNVYNPEICLQRVNQLYKETVRYAELNGIKEIHLVNLSDLIAGRIHSQLRIESREDVISQVIHVQEILIDFIENLSKNYKVYYYDCLDNHSRIEPDRKESLDIESLARLMFFTFGYAFKGNPNVEICPNEYAMDIITFNCNGFRVAGVHGDRDKPTKVIGNISRLTKEHFDLVLTAHLHHFSCDEQNRTLVISNGSLMGTDNYAESLRLDSAPSQNIIIVTEDNVAETIHRVILE